MRGSILRDLSIGTLGWLCVACTGHIGNPQAIPEDGATSPEGSGAAANGGTSTHHAQSGGTTTTTQTTDPSSVSGTTGALEGVPTTSAYPRLSHRQWALAAQDLLALDSPPDVSAFSKDAPAATGFDNTGGQLEVSQTLWEDYQKASEALAASVAADSSKLSSLLPADLPADPQQQAEAIVARLGERAFRRPLTTDEIASFSALFQQGTSLYPGRDALSAGSELTLQALMQSPAFIYRPENANDADADGVAPLSDHEIATRLSFMLWDAPPDRQLAAAANAGALHTQEQIVEQAERMLDDPRSADKLLEFHRQLLELRRYDTRSPAGLPAGIGATLRAETEQFIRASLVDDAGSFADLMTASFSFVNRDTAALYGLSGSFGDELTRTELEPAERAGLLTQPGFLMARSGDTAPILRGVFVNLKLLCADLPPPPVFSPPTMSGVTRRERIESITGKGTCGEGCHAAIINPAGYPLEYFDNEGRYRTQDNGKSVDGTSSYAFLDGTRDVDGPVQWADAIATSSQAHACYVRHWLEFGLGRPYDADEDAALVERVAKASREEGRSVQQLLTMLVQSPSFRAHKLEAP